MAFTIELSLYKNKSQNVTLHNTTRREQAEHFNCKMQYFMHEIEGFRNNISENDCIQTVIFDIDEYDNMIEYMKLVRQEKISYIECVYKDDNTCDILYVSPRYLKKLDKNSVKLIKYNIKKNKDEHKDVIHNVIKNIKI